MVSESFSRIGMPKNGSLFMCDGKSWSTVVEEGEQVDASGSGATTSVIGAMTLGVGRSTLDEGLSKYQLVVEPKDSLICS
ncbi:hypothetical protein Tco_0940938 [Tanacetum coccineum]|uniref:Uncharacterized protein n=1 Tax=Tanacetum coccineum TaxID=301880 RepID=A0ABQ5DR35_9ASTR